MKTNKQKTDNFIDKFDLYAQSVPGLNFEGRSHIGSYVGCFFSTLVLFTFTCISIIKFAHLVTNKNPRITSTVQHDAFSTNLTALEVDMDTF